jgi:hypothetical protein
MAPSRLLAALAGGLMLAGCAGTDRYENRTYANDGWGSRSGGYYGYPSRYYGYPYRYYDNRRYYDYDRDDDDADRDRDRDRADRDRDRNDRRERADPNSFCDERTDVCYRDGKVSTPATREEFGRDAARRTARLRERHETRDLYLPRRNLVCSDRSSTCYRGGEPDRRATREEYGKKATRRTDKD